jgi:hypothetical protein
LSFAVVEPFEQKKANDAVITSRRIICSKKHICFFAGNPALMWHTV